MSAADGCWVEVGSRVYARRYAELDLTTGLVVGAERALVVDTRGDRAQGAELAAAVRAVTPLPVTVVYTHAHFDHCFGTCAFEVGRILAHPGCARTLADTAETQRAEWTGYYRERGDPDTAAALAATTVVPPTDLVVKATLDLGGRTATISHPGPGHTDHDLVVHVPDPGVLFAGDLVERGAPPDFTDAHPLAWPDALAALPEAAVVVPGHGDPVERAFVAGQRAELAEVAGLCGAVLDGSRPEAELVRRSPYPEATTRTALARARLTR